MGAVKGILFDFNGTLFFDSDLHIEAFLECFRRYSLPPQDREYIVKNIFGRTNAAIFREHYCPDATDAQAAEFEHLKEGLYMDMCRARASRLSLVSGVPEMLDYLSERGIPFCIATGSPLENVEFYFEHLGLGKWFTLDNIVYCDGSFAGKPAPDIYRLAAQRLGLDASECAVFEDGTSGILAARAAGAASVIAVWENGLPCPLTEQAHADAVYHSFEDWKQILTSLGI